jgi:anti-anti-sigma factor
MSVGSSLTLAGEMTIYQAAELKPKLLAALSCGANAIDIDLDAVTEIDSAGIQLLLAARSAIEASGGTLTVAARSAAVQEVFDLFGVADRFADPRLTDMQPSRGQPT